MGKGRADELLVLFQKERQKNNWLSKILFIRSGKPNSKGIQTFEQFQKLVYYQFLGTLTGRGVSRVNYEVSRLSKLREDARRCSKDFQQVWYELEMFKVCRDACRAR